MTAESDTERINDEVMAIMAELQLKGVFLGGVSMDVNRDVAPSREEKEINVNVEHKVRLEETPEVLRAVTSFTVDGRKPKTRKAFVRIKGTFDVLFERPATELSKESAAEIAKTSTMVVWPYVRELIANLAMRSGVAVPLPPLVKIADMVADED